MRVVVLKCFLILSLVPNAFLTLAGPVEKDCNINWASWADFTGKSAKGTIEMGKENIDVSLTTNFRFDSSPDIFGHSSFQGYISHIPNSIVPAISWSLMEGPLTTMCFSKPVKDPLLMIASLGTSGSRNPPKLNFSLPYEVVYDGGGMEYSEDKTSLSGKEGYAVIQFKGEITCITIKSTGYERYTNLTWGLEHCVDIVKPAPAFVAQAQAPPRPKITVKPAPVIVVPEKMSPVIQESDNHLKIVVWDFDGMDRDSVSLKFNGEQVGPQAIALQLFKQFGDPQFTYPLEFQKGSKNTLEIYAISEGIKPNTTVGLLIIYDDRRKTLYFTLKAKETVTVDL